MHVKSRRGRKLQNFSNRQCKFLTGKNKFHTEQIIGAPNFNFASEFSQNGNSSTSNLKLCVFEPEIDGEKLSDMPIFSPSSQP